MNQKDRSALDLLEGALPETDERNVWEPALQRMDRRRKLLEWLIMFPANIAMVAAIFFGFVAVINLLPAQLHIGLRIGIGVGGGGASGAMMRALLASIPGFGLAKELKRISDAVEPFHRYIDWLSAKDRIQ